MSSLGKPRPEAPVPNTFLDLINKELPDIPYWIDPILPKTGKLLIGGEAKIGKSWAMLEIVRSLATGNSPFNWERISVPEPAKVLYVEQELGEHLLQPRLLDSFAGVLSDEELGRITYVSKDTNVVLSELDGMNYLEELIEKSGAQVVILDPMSKIHFYDENNATDMGRLFNFLDQIINNFRDKRALSLVLVHHYRKPPTQADAAYDPLTPYNFRGTRWFDDPDAIVTFRRLENLRHAHESWRMQARFTFRGPGGPIDDSNFIFNEENDLRIKYDEPVDIRPATVAPLVQEPRRTTFAPA